MTMKTTAEGNGGGALLRRMILVLAVAAVMAAMLAVSAMPAMAKANPPSCEEGQSTARDNQPTNSDRFTEHNFKVIACATGVHPGP